MLSRRIGEMGIATKKRGPWLGTRGLQYTLNRIRKIEQAQFGKTLIVPGGHWLLAADFSGNLMVYDLHASPITPKPLIPQNNQTITFMAIDIDLETRPENLTFILAISPLTNPGGLVSVLRVA